MNLNTGAVTPKIALGVGSNDDRVLDAILNAIKIGYRAFDTATMYNTEGVVGEALQLAFKSGLVKREDVFVTTKLSPADNQPANVLPSLQKSLSNLQLDYVDLYLVHWPAESIGKGSYKVLSPIQRQEVWEAMEACVNAGLAKAIGVSNWSIKKLEELLLHAHISPAVNQVEFHPLLQQNSLRAYCESKGILMCAYTSLGAPGSFYGSGDVMSHPIISEIAQKMGKTPAQVILRWTISKKVVPIVRSYTYSRQVNNFDVFGWDLADEDINAIDGIKEKKRIIDASAFVNSIDGPVKDVNEIWDE
jgi:diketogulonate reductase-like aldo/keto reductase